MAIEARLESLDQQHQRLETALSEEVLRPAFDDTKVSEMKRQKLAIKDEIKNLRSKMSA